MIFLRQGLEELCEGNKGVEEKYEKEVGAIW